MARSSQQRRRARVPVLVVGDRECVRQATWAAACADLELSVGSEHARQVLWVANARADDPIGRTWGGITCRRSTELVSERLHARADGPRPRRSLHCSIAQLDDGRLRWGVLRQRRLRGVGMGKLRSSGLQFRVYSGPIVLLPQGGTGLGRRQWRRVRRRLRVLVGPVRQTKCQTSFATTPTGRSHCATTAAPPPVTIHDGPEDRDGTNRS